MKRSGIIPIHRFNPEPSVVNRLAAYLSEGIPVVLPTETQHALAADATNSSAVEAVRTIKGRSGAQPFSIFLAGIDALAPWGISCPTAARLLAEAFWPGPLTLILPVDNAILGGLGASDRRGGARTVGIRVSPEPIVGALIERLGRPLIATSANPSGRELSPIMENRWLAEQARLGRLIWARPSRFVRHQASTVVDCSGAQPRQLRPGPITAARWKRVLTGRTER